MNTQDCSLMKEHPKKLSIIDFCKRKIKTKKNDVGMGYQELLTQKKS